VGVISEHIVHGEAK